MTENEISRHVVDVSYKIHKQYGPGLLENPYKIMAANRLIKRGLEVRREVPIPLIDEGILIDESFRADMIVNGKVILEFKATEKMHPVYRRQLRTYLKVTNLKLGLVLNFGMETMKEGIIRMINGQLEEPDQNMEENNAFDPLD